MRRAPRNDVGRRQDGARTDQHRGSISTGVGGRGIFPYSHPADAPPGVITGIKREARRILSIDAARVDHYDQSAIAAPQYRAASLGRAGIMAEVVPCRSVWLLWCGRKTKRAGSVQF